VDDAIDSTDQPAPELPDPAPTDIDRAVAGPIAGEIDVGAGLQVAIAAMPNVVSSLLLERGVRNPGTHPQMRTDGIMDLYRAGAVTGSATPTHPGTMVCSFAQDSQALCSGLDRKRDVRRLLLEMTNIRYLVMAKDRVVPIDNVVSRGAVQKPGAVRPPSCCARDGSHRIPTRTTPA